MYGEWEIRMRGIWLLEYVELMLGYNQVVPSDNRLLLKSPRSSLSASLNVGTAQRIKTTRSPSLRHQGWTHLNTAGVHQPSEGGNGTGDLGGRKGKLGAYAMKRVAAGADLPTPWLFEPAKPPTIQPITAGSADSSPRASTRYSFSNLSVLLLFRLLE